MKIAHISDIHIRNTILHKEYDLVFLELFNKLKEERPDIVVMTGDLAHSKTILSPEYVMICSEFLKSMSQFLEHGGFDKPLIMILGNHDGNMKTEVRVDAVYPIMELLNKKNIYLLVHTGAFLEFDNFKFTLKSCFDDKPLPPPDPNRINVLLYHGVVKGSVAANGFVFEHGISPDEVDSYDYAMLGDIHKHQFVGPRAAYAGSLISQNFGEEFDHGFLIWEIETQNEFKCRFVKLESACLFYNIKGIDLVDDLLARIPKHIIPKISIELQGGEDPEAIAGVQSKIRNAFKDAHIFINAASSAMVTKIIESGCEDIRNSEVQNKYIEEFFKGDSVDVEAIKEMNRSVLLSSDTTDMGYGSWDIEELYIKNMFSFGEANIDFKQYYGKVVGLFAPNKSGKSNTIQSMLYIPFQSTTKGHRRTVDIINNKEVHCKGHEIIRTEDGNRYKISVDLERSKDGETAKQTVLFDRVDEGGKTIALENDENTIGTKRLIRKKLGTIDTATLTSISPQGKASLVIDKLPSERSVVLQEFLGLNVFEEKAKSAKFIYGDMERKVKELEKCKPGKEIDSLREKMAAIKNILHTNSHSLMGEQADLEKFLGELGSVSSERNALIKLNKVVTRSIGSITKDLEDVLKNKNKIPELVSSLSKEKAEMPVIDYEGLLQFESGVEEMGKVKAGYIANVSEVTSLEREIKSIDMVLSRLEKDISVLGEIPCSVPQSSICPLLKNTLSSEAQKKELLLNKTDKENQIKALQDKMKNKDILVIETNISYMKSRIDEIKTLDSRSRRIDELFSAYEIETVRFNNKIDSLILEKKQHEDNIENDNKLVVLDEVYSKCCEKVKDAKVRIKTIEDEARRLSVELGGVSSQLRREKDILDEYLSIKSKSDVYKNYAAAFSKWGIPYQIMKSKLAHINNEISNVLMGLVNFKCYMEDKDGSLDIFIEDIKGVRRVEMASGMEAMMCSIAIRAALTSITTLPKPSIFCIDEGFGVLDADHLANISSMIKNLKRMFKTTLIITHVNELKDCVDDIIELSVDENEQTFIRE